MNINKPITNTKAISNNLDTLRKQIVDVDRQLTNLQHRKLQLERKYNAQRRLLWGKTNI